MWQKDESDGQWACCVFRVIWCVWAGWVESMPCAPHTADCFSDQAHPSRAHSAGTLPSQAADVRGDLQKHAASWRGPKGGVGVVVAVGEGSKRKGKLTKYGFVIFWHCFLHELCEVHFCYVDMLIPQVRASISLLVSCVMCVCACTYTILLVPSKNK